MIETITQFLSSNFNTSKAEKHNGTAIIRIVSVIGTYAITGEIIPRVFSPSKY